MLGIGINYFDRRISKFLSCSFSFFVLSFFLSFFLPSFLPSHGRMALPQLGVPDVTLILPPVKESPPFWGPLALLALCVPEEKRPSPGRGARKPPRVKRVLPFQVGRKYRQGFRESSFHFSERTSPVPPQSASGFPLREKTPRPMGL